MGRRRRDPKMQTRPDVGNRKRFISYNKNSTQVVLKGRIRTGRLLLETETDLDKEPDN